MKTGVPDLSSVGAPGVAQNGTVGFPQQLSLFYAGKIAPHLGGMIQLTYANDSGTIGIDNTDLRFSDEVLLPNNGTLTYGLSLNNNPTVQDSVELDPCLGLSLCREQRQRLPACWHRGQRCIRAEHRRSLRLSLLE